MENSEEKNVCERLEENGNQLEEEPLMSQRSQVSKSDELSRKVASNCSGQDSGLSSGEGFSQCQAASFPEKGMKSSPYITSTPKKGVQFLESININNFEVFPSQMILDDPLLSSIDEPGGDLTDQEVNSLTYDDESEDTSSTRLCETKIRADIGSTSTNCTLMSRFMNDGSTKQKDKERNSFSGTLRRDVIAQPDLLAVKRNLFDIPVSPKLKSRVRQRLFTLVNSIDGYEGKVDIENDEARNLENRAISSNNLYATYRNSQNPLEVSGRLLPQASVIDRGKGQNERHNLSHVSSLSNDMSERFTSAMSSVLESQLRTLHLHQEQLSKDRLNFTLQKKEEEVDARISFYKDKLYQMIQMVEEVETKLGRSEREKLQQSQYFKNKIKEQSERHRESLSLLRLEYEKKVQVAESTAAAARLEATKACDKKVYEIVTSSRERTAAFEKKHQDHIDQLNSTISELQAERREKKWHDIDKVCDMENHLKVDVTQISKEEDVLKAEIDYLKQRLVSVSEADKKTVEHQKHICELEIKHRAMQEEVDVWRDEATQSQQKLVDMEILFKRQTQEALEESKKLEQNKMEELKSKFNQERNQLSNVIETLKGELLKALTENEKLKHHTIQLEKEIQEQHKDQSSIITLEKEVISLGAQLRDSVSNLSRQKESLHQLQHMHAKELAQVKEQTEQEMIHYRLLMERERSIAVSRAMVHREEETMALLRGVENRYQELLKTLQAHFKAQIEEYKKAVKILKLKVKRLEEGSAI